MKKLVYILVAIFAFFFGFGIYKLRPLFMPISLVEISQDANLYYFNDVNIKAYLEVSPSGEYCCSVIDFQDSFIEGAGFSLNDRLQWDDNLQKFRRELYLKNKELDNEKLDKGEFVAEVIIVGRIRKVNTCFGPDYFIEAKEVKQISPVRFISREEFRKHKLINKE